MYIYYIHTELSTFPPPYLLHAASPLQGLFLVFVLYHSCQALHYAAYHGHLPVVMEILKSNPNKVR